MAQETWIEVRVLVPARMQEEASLYLTDFTGRGVIIEEDNVPAGGVVIRGYFRPEEYGAWQRQELQDYLKRLSTYELYPLGLEIRQVAEEDWAEAWKAHFKPVKLTDRLVIRPPWEEYAAQAGETVITIYPGMAFGTGRHSSTLLCLQALEQVWDQGLPHSANPWQVLDVGTGTGILALAAARLGAEVVAIDLDPEAVAAALENVRLNNLIDRVMVEDTPAHLPAAAVRPHPGQHHRPGFAPVGRGHHGQAVERRNSHHLRLPGRRRPGSGKSLPGSGFAQDRISHP